MFKSSKATNILARVLLIGAAALLSGCATCCGDAAPKTGMLHGAIGCDDCDKSDSKLLVEKEMPRQIVVGKPYSYTIKVTNRSGCGCDDVVVMEKIADQYEMSTADPQPTKVSGRVAEWALGYLGPKESKVLTITGAARGAGATIACTKADCNPLLCLGPEAISPDLKVVLEAPSRALVCDVIPVRVTVTNTGTGVAQDVKVTQALPQGLTTRDGDTAVNVEVGSLAGGESKTYTVNLKAAQSGSYTNSASATAANDLSASSGGVTTVVVQPQLRVGISGPGSVIFGRNADYKVTVENVGNADSENTVVTTSIPSGMSFVSASDNGSKEGGAVVWNLGTLGAQKAVNLSATFKGVGGGSAESVAQATGVCCQEASAAAKVDIQGIPAVLLEVVDVNDPVEVGGMEKFIIVVTNQGTALDNNIVVKVASEKNFDFVSSSGATPAKAESAKAVEFSPLASLAPQQRATWEIQAKAVQEGDHRLKVEMTSDAIGRSVEETEATRVY